MSRPKLEIDLWERTELLLPAGWIVLSLSDWPAVSEYGTASGATPDGHDCYVYVYSKKPFIAIETPLGPDALGLVSFTGQEELGRLFQFETELISDNPKLNFDDLIGQKAAMPQSDEGSDGAVKERE